MIVSISSNTFNMEEIKMRKLTFPAGGREFIQTLKIFEKVHFGYTQMRELFVVLMEGGL